jgi:hypothetical protein
VTTIEITATLARCPECAKVMVLANGVIESHVTFWMKDGVLKMVTPHTEDCPLRGKPLP